MLTGAAFLAILVALWNYIKGVLVQLSGRLVAQVQIDFPLAAGVMPFCRTKFEVSRFSPQHFYSQFFFVRPVTKVQCVTGEHYNSKGTLFWKGWLPIWACFTMDKEMNNAQVIQIKFLRGTIQVCKFMEELVDFFNNEILHDAKKRFKIHHVFGSDGKPARLSSSDSNSQAANGPEYNYIETCDLIKWKREDLGPLNLDAGSAVANLALNDAALNFIEEFRRWRRSEPWFIQRGVPWKMGATLYGEPGNGKSALIAALAKDENVPVYVYNLATLYDDELHEKWREMLAQTPCIAVFEDFDTVFKGRENIAKGHLTLDMLLNVIDGIERPHGLVVCLTTNRIDHIDAALMRPGRIDRVVEMTRPSYEGRLKLANRMLDGFPYLAERIARQGEEMTGAEFQLLCERTAMERFHDSTANNDAQKNLRLGPEDGLDDAGLCPDEGRPAGCDIYSLQTAERTESELAGNCGEAVRLVDYSAAS